MEGLSNVTPEETKRSNLNSFKEPRITIRSAVHGNKVMSEMKIIDDKTDYAIPTTIKSSKKSSKNTSLKRVESLKSPVSILKSSTSLKRVKTQKSPNQLSSQRNDTSLKKLESNTSKNSRKFLSVKKDYEGWYVMGYVPMMTVIPYQQHWTHSIYIIGVQRCMP